MNLGNVTEFFPEFTFVVSWSLRVWCKLDSDKNPKDHNKDGRQMSSTSNESEKKEQEPNPVDISSLDIYQLIELFIILLNEKAWRYIGLRVEPGTNKINKDLAKAHVAIDCIISLVDKIEPSLDNPEKERLRRLITDLQLNYAEQMK